MYVTSVSLVCVLSLVSGNVLYFKPHSKNEAVAEFDQVPEDSPDIIVYDPVKGHKSRVPTTVESAVGERPFRSVMCPGGTSECPDDTTCCKLANGRYGCCPYPEAVCCSDMKHCCRHGFTCNLSKERCEQGNLFMPLISKLPASKRIQHQKKNRGSQRLLASSMIAGPQNICPGGEQACASGYSCCGNANNTYSCCGYSPAHCCADNVHCCPANYKCLSNGLCEDKNGFTLPRSLKVEASAIKVEANIVCKDKSQCATGNTCCMKGTNVYGCCPLPNAICCVDKKHCCPNGYQCGPRMGFCMKAYHIIDLSVGNKLDHSKKLANDPKDAAEEKVVSTDVVCPDQKSKCQTGQTCCETQSGGYGCCPAENAVCCPDKIHCCPQGTHCGAGKCYRGNYSINWLEKSSSYNVSKPRGGVCCGDRGDHCCPEGYTCDLQKKKCIKEGSNQVTEWLTSVQSTALSVQNVVCPDGKSECPTGNTCCLGKEGTYGCCPLPNAVCCPDEKHCCKENTKCDSTSHKCLQSNGLLTDSFEKSESQPVVRSSNTICPDGQSHCPDGSTCCAVAGGSYGCCPLPNAVCCADDKHCCPENYKCDTGSGTCTKNNGMSMEWLLKTESQPTARSPDVICPDGRSQCPSGDTCCKVGENKYGCCPQPNAVCCADDKHCCPENYKCDTGSGRCTKNNGMSMEWLLKTESQPTARSPDVICPDGRSQCPSGDTCCKVGENKYGCCPQPNAVCCADDKHCCPENYKCDTGSGRCTKNNGMSMEWLLKTESQPTARSPDVICPDGRSQCPSGDTCCKVGENKYGCCPQPNAVCCADDKHCCPHDYKCDTGSGRCTKNNGMSMEWLLKTESKPTARSTYVICPDGHSQCPSGDTCCKVGENKYGCCPQPNAVCCADDKHCCPHDYKCDTGSGRCTKNNGMSMEWLLKTESQPTARSTYVICPDGHSQCPSGDTCCKVGENKYGCCPQPNAVCCADEKHCCPHNYKCDTVSGTCTKNNGMSMEWLLKTESQPTARSPDVICPDGHSQCPSGDTCCKVGENKYGCCPQPNAVCCEDDIHCCPHNTKCDTAHGKCTASNGLSMNWLDKTESQPVEVLKDIICPDDKSTCPPGNTCCLTGVGKYGCCPRPEAVCCDDKKHCCPKNSKCNTTSERCINSDGLSMDWLEKGASVSVKNLSPSFALIGPAAYDNEPVSTSVDCPGGGSCPDTNTCCKDPTGKYGCCPYAKAVCCPDGKYCCPHEYICDGNMICRDPNGIKRKDFSTNLFLQRIANKVGGKN
ncbi:multiple epidermal growth factor-like domains protein 6 [Pecten maximus]|uniref:multiple epidermal growth factor-like domains protein 6 n=1 Tax=Pecten maximus TaxID=6579 RepID=UPI001458285F|nr:multiple epidermal growth factor-like domains protein 6 [Pecten maximus]